MLHVKHLLIGGGAASTAAVRAIRGIDPRAEVLIVAAETFRPYDRTTLSKTYLRERGDKQRLQILPVGWFAENHVQLRTGTRASRLEVGRRVVTLESGEDVSFDSLLIATGMSPMHLDIPGADFPNVHYLRNIVDAERLHHAIDKAKAEGKRHASGRG